MVFSNDRLIIFEDGNPIQFFSTVHFAPHFLPNKTIPFSSTVLITEMKLLGRVLIILIINGFPQELSIYTARSDLFKYFKQKKNYSTILLLTVLNFEYKV